MTPDQPESPWLRRNLGWLALFAVVAVLCVLFPRMLAFVELAARELRVLWWLVLAVALAAYFFFFFGRPKK